MFIDCDSKKRGPSATVQLITRLPDYLWVGLLIYRLNKDVYFYTPLLGSDVKEVLILGLHRFELPMEVLITVLLEIHSNYI